MTEGPTEHVQPSAHAAAVARQELAALAAGAAQGDTASLSQLQRRLHAGLVRWFTHTWPQDSERVERLAHETWIEVWQALASGRYDARRAAISTFAFAVAGNLRLRELRSIGRSIAAADEAEPSLDVHDAATSLAHASTLEALRHLISDPSSPLDESERTILGLLARGMGDRDIARELGVSPSTGHERKKRALARLASELRTLGHHVHDEATSPSPSLMQGKLS
ncbi:MAG: RNA polymerase sigma factor [Planctomycetes bacterium]|nr:RNA polymerase sigma factor [Planctomycetota bacterium]